MAGTKLQECAAQVANELPVFVGEDAGIIRRGLKTREIPICRVRSRGGSSACRVAWEKL